MKDVAISVVFITYNLSLVIGAGYLCYWKGASPWIFAVPILFCVTKWKVD